MEQSALRQLLPHAGDALWLQRLLRHDVDSPYGEADWLCAEADWSCLARFGANASPALLFEAAAQLCAVHGALQAAAAGSSDAAPGTAMLGKLSDLRLHFEPAVRSGTLAIRVDRQAASAAGAQYTFAVHSGERLLLDGRLLLVLAHA